MYLKRLISLASICVLISCSKGNDNKNPNDRSAVRANLENIFKNSPETFNLLTNNLEIPSQCKPPLSTEANKRAFVRMRGRINRCVYYITQEPSLNNFHEVKHCIQQIGEHFNQVEDLACRDLIIVPGATGNVVDVFNNLIGNYYTGNVRVIENNETVFKWEHVQDYFSLWAHWFNESRNSVYPVTDKLVASPAHIIEFEENLLRPFWDDIKAYTDDWKSTFGDIVKEIEPTNPDGSIRTPEEIAELRLDKNNKFEIFKTMLGVNKKVIDLAFASDLGKTETYWNRTSSNKYPSPLLAGILGDAIHPFFERIQVITKIYDIACKLKNCTTEFYKQNKTFWMVKYLNNIAKGSGIEAIDLDRSDPLNDFLMNLVDKESEIRNLIAAMNETFEVSDISLAVKGSDFPQFLNSFSNIFAQSHDLLANFENTKFTDQTGVERAGYFSSGNVSEINVGFSKRNMDIHIKKVKASNNELISLREKFAAQKHTLIQEILSLNSSAVSIDQLEDKINIDLTDMFNLKNQIDSVRSFISESRNSFSKKVKSLIENQQSSSVEFFTHPVETFVVNASDTSIGNPNVVDGSILANIDSGGQFSKGDLLRVNVSGEWSPTCAITNEYGSSVVNAKTSSKGYTLIETAGVGVVQSVDKYSMKESFSSTSVTVSACGKSGGPDVVGSLSVCANSTSGRRSANGKRTSTNTSNTRRSDASFNIGVTLENTPYPFIPAGSLLLVAIPTGLNGKLDYKDMYILNGSDAFIVPEDNLNYYLIGNDCSSSANSGSLTVQVTRQSPQGTQAINYIDKITALSSDIQSRVDGLISSGQVSHQLLQSIRQELLGSVGQDINSFTGTTRLLLDSYISNEIAILDYKSQLTNMERLLETKKQNIISLLNQFSSESEQRLLRVHTRNWLISRLDLDFVNQEGENENLYTLNRILYILEHSLVSYLDFKYRNDEDKNFILGDVSLLSNIDISDNFDTISNRITNFVSVLLDNLQDDIDNKPIVPQTTVGIRVPNPFYEPTFSGPYPDDSVHPKMDTARATNLWNKIASLERLGEDKASFSIYLEDLYTDYGLSCYTETPIIETAGFFFIPENEGFVTDFNNNYKHKNSKLFIDGLTKVPFESGLRSYNFVENSWRFMDVATRMAISPNDAMRILVTEFPPSYDVETGLGTGRPIFGDFKIGDLKGLRKVGNEVYIGHTPIKEIKELFIGYIISASNSDFNVNLNWIDYCKVD